MNFQVPQFIEVEDKIFGPLTFRQFVYLAGGGGLAFVLYVYLPIYLAAIPMMGVVGLAIALSFYRYNNRPLIGFLESVFRFQVGPKLYIWKKEQKRAAAVTQISESGDRATVLIPKLSSSKLKDLSWSLDVRENIK